jgi:hypothetical protein
MQTYLRVLGSVLLIGGLAICAVATTKAIGDEAFFKAGEALARHPDHMLFQGEYYAALVRHLVYIGTAVLAGLLGIVGSAVLLGLHAILRRLVRVEAASTVSARAR